MLLIFWGAIGPLKHDLTFIYCYRGHLKKKLDGVGPIDNRPSTDKLHKEKPRKTKHKPRRTKKNLHYFIPTFLGPLVSEILKRRKKSRKAWIYRVPLHHWKPRKNKEKQRKTKKNQEKPRIKQEKLRKPRKTKNYPEKPRKTKKNQ